MSSYNTVSRSSTEIHQLETAIILPEILDKEPVCTDTGLYNTDKDHHTRKGGLLGHETVLLNLYAGIFAE